MNARESAEDVLSTEADPSVAAAADRLIEAGTHCWSWDPDVDNVVGLVPRNAPTEALIIVWLEARDFSCDEEGLGL